MNSKPLRVWTYDTVGFELPRSIALSLLLVLVLVLVRLVEGD